MRPSRYGMLAVGLVLAATVAVRADDSVAARALVDKALLAHGGAARLAELPAVTAKFKGTFHGLGDAVTMTGEVATQGADQQKIVVEVEVAGQKLRIAHILNRDKGWLQFNDNTVDMDPEHLADAKEEAYAEWVATLTPLKDKAFSLAPAGEVSIENRPALGVTISSKDRRDVGLYFDKETGLLVKTETRVKDETSGQEVTQETFLSDYKDVQETRQAMKFTVQRAGKLYLEGEVTDVQLTQKLDDSVFARP